MRIFKTISSKTILNLVISNFVTTFLKLCYFELSTIFTIPEIQHFTQLLDMVIKMSRHQENTCLFANEMHIFVVTDDRTFFVKLLKIFLSLFLFLQTVKRKEVLNVMVSMVCLKIGFEMNIT
jgi:hypothetical protein